MSTTTPSNFFTTQFKLTSPLPPHFKSNSTTSRDTRSTTEFCKILSSFYTHTPAYLSTKAANLKYTPTKRFLDPYIFALYYQNFQHLNPDSSEPITLYFTDDPTKPTIFLLSFLTQDFYTDF